MTSSASPPKPPDKWDSTHSKGSEKYLDFVKAEFERALAKSRVIDERARGNATLAAAAVAVIGLLKPASLSAPYVALVVLAAFCVIWILYLTAEVIRNRPAEMNKGDWFEQTAEQLFYEEINYANLLLSLQQSWINLLKGQRISNEERFAILHRQRPPLVGLLVIVGLLVLISLLTPNTPAAAVPSTQPTLHLPFIGPSLPVK